MLLSQDPRSGTEACAASVLKAVPRTLGLRIVENMKSSLVS